MTRQKILADLDCAVCDAANFFRSADERWRDGDQPAHDVIAHLVFWHREYARVVKNLAEGVTPHLRAEAFPCLNQRAHHEFARQSLPTLARMLSAHQRKLDRELRRVPNWRIDFPLKKDVQFGSISQRAAQITAHIRGHVTRLKRAARRGEKL